MVDFKLETLSRQLSGDGEQAVDTELETAPLLRLRHSRHQN